jgi:GAF domain-containing protein
VERVSALVGAPRASLAVLDPASQTPVTVATWTQSSSGPRPANLRVHEELARWVTTQRTPALITDCGSDPRARTLGMMAVGSLMSVPLLVGQQVLGALTISSPSISAFGQYHLRLLELVADLAALAMFQTRQLEAVGGQTRPLARPLDVSGVLEATRDARSIVGQAFADIQRLVRCDEAVIFRYDADTETLCAIAGLGKQSPRLAQARISVRDPHSVTAWVAYQRRPLLLASESTGFIGRSTERLLAQRELSLLAVPLVTRERLWGVITLARSVSFETSDLRTLLNVSQGMALALVQIGDAR